MGDVDIKNIFSKKEMCYYVMVDKFFKRCDSKMIKKMIQIINCDDDISLRILDWFVTRYAKKGIDFTRDDDVYDVHINYKAQLKSYKKKYFDPFRRKYKFDYIFTINGEKNTLRTTIGQLNFFAWAITNNIIMFVSDHLNQITKAMNLSNKEDKKNKEIKKKNNRQDINSDIISDEEEDIEIDDNEMDDMDDTDNTDEMDDDSKDENKSSDNSNNVSNKTNNKMNNKSKKEIVKNNVEQFSEFNNIKNKPKKITKRNIINITASKKIENDEVELTLSFD